MNLILSKMDHNQPVLKSTPTASVPNATSKFHKKLIGVIGLARADAMDRRAGKLALDDQRRMARCAAGRDKYANTLLTGTPDESAKFTALQFETAVQVKLGAPVTATANLVGNPITNHANC